MFWLSNGKQPHLLKEQLIKSSGNDQNGYACDQHQKNGFSRLPPIKVGGKMCSISLYSAAILKRVFLQYLIFEFKTR